MMGEFDIHLTIEQGRMIRFMLNQTCKHMGPCHETTECFKVIEEIDRKTQECYNSTPEEPMAQQAQMPDKPAGPVHTGKGF